MARILGKIWGGGVMNDWDGMKVVLLGAGVGGSGPGTGQSVPGGSNRW